MSVVQQRRGEQDWWEKLPDDRWFSREEMREVMAECGFEGTMVDCVIGWLTSGGWVDVEPVSDPAEEDRIRNHIAANTTFLGLAPTELKIPPTSCVYYKRPEPEPVRVAREAAEEAQRLAELARLKAKPRTRTRK